MDQTLQVAVLARSRKERRQNSARVVQSLDTIIPDLGLSEALRVKVGNDIVPGTSGGERKRTSIAEILASGSSIQFWDNSTRGLDSVNALAFATALRKRVDTTGSMAFSTLYQCPEDVYRHFDKVLLLYDGHQIFFGDTNTAKAYFMALGFICPDRMTTSDFLTSITNPLEREVQEAFKYEAPQTPQEFSRVWRTSRQRADLSLAIDSYCESYPLDPSLATSDTPGLSLTGESTSQHHSPYVINYAQQVLLCMVRNFQRLRNDLVPPLSSIVGNTILSIVLGSMFYAMPENTSSFYGRGVSLFFIVLTNTCLGAFEGVQLWDHRPIVEKHFQYAFYHPSTEAVASLVCDLPNKILLTICFNVPYYFLANMRRTPAAFFTFYLFAFASLLAGSMLFRTIGAMSKTTVQSIAPGATFILMLIIYTGFVLPIPDMPPWFRWFAYLNPIGYAFESLMINEFSGREFGCHAFVPQGPSYQALGSDQRMCAIVGAMPQANMVNGDDYLIQKFSYGPENMWRNLGIIFAITIGLCCIYLLATETNSSEQSKGEILTFCKGNDKLRRSMDLEATATSELSPAPVVTAKAEDGVQTASGDVAKEQTLAATFIWNSLCYEVNSKKNVRRLLKDVEGWVKPGTLTALMGPSGAGEPILPQ